MNYENVKLCGMSYYDLGMIFINVPLLWEELEDGSIQIYTNEWPCYITEPNEYSDENELPFFLMDDTSGVWNEFESIETYTRNIKPDDPKYHRVVKEYSDYKIMKGLL